MMMTRLPGASPARMWTERLFVKDLVPLDWKPSVASTLTSEGLCPGSLTSGSLGWRQMAFLPTVEAFRNVVSSEPPVRTLWFWGYYTTAVCPETKSAVPAVKVVYFYPSKCVFSVFHFPSPQISTSALRGSTTAERTPCVLTPPAPLCASATQATSGSMTIPAQVSPFGWPSDCVKIAVIRFWIGRRCSWVQNTRTGLADKPSLQSSLSGIR